MLLPAYDILKKDAAALVWVEAMDNLQSAKLRIRELAARSEGEYVIFDQRTRRIKPPQIAGNGFASQEMRRNCVGRESIEDDEIETLHRG